MTAILTERPKQLLARERIENYACGEWVRGTGKGADLFHAVTGEKIGEASSEGLDFKAMVEYGRTVGGPALRKMTFHERAVLLKALGQLLMDRKEEFYELSRATGATRTDSWIDIDVPSASVVRASSGPT